MAAEIPESMSAVLGSWVRGLDGLLEDPGSSGEWVALLPLAAATGRELEQERLSRILDWMWERVLPSLKPAINRKEMWIADPEGLGGELWGRVRRHRDNAYDFAAYASVYAGVDAPSWMQEYYRSAAFAAGEAARAAWIAQDNADNGEIANAALAAGHVAFSAAKAYGIGRSIESVNQAAEAALRGVHASPDIHTWTPAQYLLHSDAVLTERCGEAYAVAYPVGRAKFWNAVKPKQLLLQLAAPHLGRHRLRPWGR